MIDLLIDLLLAAAALLAIYGVGRSLSVLLPPEPQPRSVRLALSLGLGLGLIATVLFLAGLLGLLAPLAGYVLLAIGLALAARQRRTLLEDLRALWEVIRVVAGGSWLLRATGLFVLAFVLLNLIGDLAPPLEGDTVHQYLLTPRYWIEAGRYVQPAHIWAATLPGNMMMMSAWTLLLRPSFSLATLVTGLGMSLFFALGVYALARTVMPRSGAFLAVALIYTMPDASYLAQSAKVDMGWAFFEALTLLAFFRWLDAPRDGRSATRGLPWLALTGVYLGLAAGSKNQTFISVALLGGWLLLRLIARRDWRGGLRALLQFGGALALAALPYYLYNAIAHRNPFYPVFADLFARFGGTPSPRSELGTEIFYAFTPGGYLANLWGMAVGHNPALGFYLGFIPGPVFLVLIVAGLLLGLYRGQRSVWRMLGYAFVFSLLWFVVKQAARHFLPGLVLLAVAAGYVLWQIDQRKQVALRIVALAAVAGIALNLVSWLGVFYWSGVYRVAFGLETRAAYIERVHDRVLSSGFPDSQMLATLNEQVGPGQRVVTQHATSALYITPDLIPLNWGDRTDLTSVHDPQALRRLFKSMDIGYILVYTDLASPDLLVNQPDFLTTYADLIAESPRARLYRLRQTEQ
ncbi:MAG: hypothetical protein IT326_06230 [Anaerolineae bacterium]|nr:hypothetical protein [Anaerolineae bacterium]